MKKILKNCFIVILFYCLIVSSFVLGQTPSDETASSSPTIAVDKDILNLKEKIANKVLEIRKKNNKAVSGFVVSNDSSLIKINSNGEEIKVKLDESLTKYFRIVGTQKRDIKLADIEKNDYAIISGVMSEDVITANVVLIDENFLVDSGKITEINKDTYNINVLTSDKNTYSLDIETVTKQNMINIKSLDLEIIGFSKLKEGDTVHFVVKKTGDPSAGGKDNNFSAIKILVIPQEYFIK